MCLDYFCFINGYRLDIPEERFYEIAKEVVESDNSRKEEVVIIIKKIIKDNWEKQYE